MGTISHNSTLLPRSRAGGTFKIPPGPVNLEQVSLYALALQPVFRRRRQMDAEDRSKPHPESYRQAPGAIAGCYKIQTIVLIRHVTQIRYQMHINKDIDA